MNNLSFILPVVSSLILILFAVRLHFFCDRRHEVFRQSCREKLSLLYFNKLSLGSVFVAILILVGETSFLWNAPHTTVPPIEELMWDTVESVICFFLSWLCFNSVAVVDAHIRFSEVSRKNKILEGIITAAAGYIWLKDSNGDYIFCDHGFCHDFFGLSTNDCDVVGFNDIDLIDAFRIHTGRHDFGSLCLSTDAITRDAGVKCHFIEIGVVGNALFVLDVIKTPLFNSEGKYDGCVGFAWTNRACEFNQVLSDLDAMISIGKAKKLGRGVYQLFDVEACIFASFIE